MLNKIKKYDKDILAVLYIIVTALWVLKGFSQRVDINLTDDTGYMVLGLRIQDVFLAGFGPLYSIMYKVLKQFTDDPVKIYDTAMYLMYIFPPVVAYGMLRSLGLRAIWALALSIGFLLSPNILSFITWSKISHYAITVIMIWVIVSLRIKETFNFLFSLVILTFLLGYIRPESHLSWYLSTIWFLFYWIVRCKDKRGTFKKVAPVLLLFVFFIFLTLGSSQPTIEKINLLINPMAGGRSNVAFAQQFTYNYCEWNGLNNFDWIQWRQISKAIFGNFHTLGEAFQHNPSVFIHHILYNIEQYILKFFLGVRAILLPPAVFHWNSVLLSIIFLAIIGGKIIYVGPSNWWLQFKTSICKYRFIIAGLALISLPSVISSVIFYTREHYLLLIMPLVLVLLTLIFLPQKHAQDNTPRIFYTLGFWITLALIWIVRPNLSDYKTYDVWEEYTYPSNRKTIEALRKMNFTQKINEIDHEGGLAVYVGKNYKWINLINKEEQSYQDFEKQYQPNFYYVTKALLSNITLTEDPYFMDIIHHPEKHGLHRIDLQKENKGYLLVQDSLKYQPIHF